MAKRRRGSRHAAPSAAPRHRPFERLVDRALAGIPLAVRAQPSTRSRSSSPTSPARASCRENDLDPDETLYGLYEGVPRTEWGADWVAMPNRITLFRLPLEEDFPDPDDLADEVRITVIHELAHHLGIDDDRLHELGID